MRAPFFPVALQVNNKAGGESDYAGSLPDKEPPGGVPGAGSDLDQIG